LYLSGVALLALAASTTPATAAPSSVVAPGGYTVSIFAKGTYGHTKPDPIFVQGGHVFVAFQNNTKPDGSVGKSTLVQYDASGKIVESTEVAGRCDGMRFNPNTHLVWITVNEDAHGALYTWNPSTNELKRYAFSAATHGGGYDDLAFVNGKAFIVASNPTLTQGKNTKPAIVRVELAGNVAKVTPVLYGNQAAQNLATGAPIRLNLTDPDSMSIDRKGNLILIAQADKQIVEVHNPGGPDQRVATLPVTTQLDDTVWPTDSDGTLYVVDAGTNTIYKIRGPLKPGMIFTEAPKSSSVPGIVGTVDPKTGTVTPVITGLSNPTGLVFVSTNH
jgi:hypothetical protein